MIILNFLLKRLLCTLRNSMKSLLALMYLTSFVQFIWMVVIRFIRQGRICSGDYKEYIRDEQDPSKRNEKYDGYFMEKEGDFFWWYTVLILGLIVFLSMTFYLGVWAFNSYTKKYINEPLIKKAGDVQYYIDYSKKEGKKAYTEYNKFYEDN